MTTRFKHTVRCSVCGTETEAIGISSTNKLWYDDLDLRPSEMMRSTMPTWVQTCPHCGYVASSVAWETKATTEWLSSDEYLSCSEVDGEVPGEFMPRLAKAFFRAHKVDLLDGYVDRARAHDDGAYVVSDLIAMGVLPDIEDDEDEDDVDFREAMSDEEWDEWRQRLMMQQAVWELDADGRIGCDADILRRTGRFDDAIAEAEQGASFNENVRQLLRGELLLAEAGDCDQHTISEVLEAAAEA